MKPSDITTRLIMWVSKRNMKVTSVEKTVIAEKCGHSGQAILSSQFVKGSTLFLQTQPTPRRPVNYFTILGPAGAYWYIVAFRLRSSTDRSVILLVWSSNRRHDINFTYHSPKLLYRFPCNMSLRTVFVLVTDPWRKLRLILTCVYFNFFSSLPWGRRCRLLSILWKSRQIKS